VESSHGIPLDYGDKITVGFSIAGVVYAPSASSGFMSQHRSLRAAATLGGKRNVLKRFERTELLKKRGQWKDGDRITGLRKTKPEA
jgi:small basic protein (TIGR04137 family)